MKKIPELKVAGLSAEYILTLESLHTHRKKVILFLRASIGNFSYLETVKFLRDIHKTMHPGDILLFGFNHKKDPGTILASYNDQSGNIRAFNYNLLHRINRE
nr:L-histidine N(alpha)-methyltransferase [Gillisia sp. JM1]